MRHVVIATTRLAARVLAAVPVVEMACHIMIECLNNYE